MTKKQDHIRSEQSRDKHPERIQKGSGADRTVRSQAKGNVADHQQPGTPKVQNDRNKMGNKEATQTNQGQRSPQARHDRQNQAGSSNQVAMRTGGKGGGRSPRGAG